MYLNSDLMIWASISFIKYNVTMVTMIPLVAGFGEEKILHCQDAFRGDFPGGR